MFILTDERLTWMPVSVPRLDAAGNPTTQKLRVQVVLVDYDRFLEITNEQGPGEERNIIHELARDWDGVQARQGDRTETVPFSAGMLDKAIQQPMFIRAFFDAYFAAWRGQKEEREGNSEGSPASGPAAAPAPTTGPRPATPTASD